MSCEFCGNKATCPDCDPSAWLTCRNPSDEPDEGLRPFTPIYYYPKEKLCFLFSTQKEFEQADAMVICFDRWER